MFQGRVGAGCTGDPRRQARQARWAWVADLPAGRQEGFGAYQGPTSRVLDGGRSRLLPAIQPAGGWGWNGRRVRAPSPWPPPGGRGDLVVVS